MRTIAIVNQKGGCGKTTTAINLAAALAERGRRTLLVDIDPQSHAAAGLAVPEDRIDQDIGDAMRLPVDRRLDPKRLVWRIGKNLDLVPSRTKLAAIEAPGGGLAEAPEREFRLARVLERLAATAPYEFCIIDCPPSIGLLTYNALAAGREVIVPVETSYFSLLGARKQVRTVKSIGRRLGMRHHTRLLATIHDPTRTLALDLYAELKREFSEQVFATPIRFDPAIPEALSFGRPVLEYAPHGVGATDHRELATCVLEIVPPRRSLEPVEISGEDDEEALAAAEVATLRPEVPRFAGRGGTTPAPNPQPVGGGVPAGERADPAGDAGGGGTAVMTAPATAARSVASAELVTVEAGEDDPKPKYRVLAMNGPLRLIEEVGPSNRAGASPELYGARVTGRRIVFVQPLEVGLRVQIAGTFNGWKPERHLMRRNPEMGIHELAVDVEPGVHGYRLVIDGRWSDDPYAAETRANPHGGRDAVVRVAGG